MKQLIVCENVFEPNTWETILCDDVRDAIMARFAEFPATARLYHKHAASSADVTPHDERSIDALAELEGPFYLIVYPELPLWAIILVIAIAVAAVSIVVLHFIRPSVSANIKNQQQASPNNGLSERQNQERVNQRIPDIVGTVQAIPDLIQVPYTIFVDNREVEIAYMCVGRGAYDYEVFGIVPLVIT